MARRTHTVTIDDPAIAATPAAVDAQGKVVIPARGARPQGRDHGKSFLLTEMSAWDATMFAAKALLLLTNSGASVPDSTTGMAGLAVAGMQALEKLSFIQIRPLLEEIIQCAQYVHKPGHPPQDARENIEEVATYMTLFRAAFVLHTGFSGAGSIPTTG